MTLEEICRSVIEAGKKATKRPWKKACAVAGIYIREDDVYEKLAACGPEHEEDIENDYRNVSFYLVTSADHAVQMAKALLVMREALFCYNRTIKYKSDSLVPDGFKDCNHCDACDAIQQAEEIMRGEQ